MNKKTLMAKVAAYENKQKDSRDETLVANILEELKKRQEERRPLERQWQLNANFVLGNQFCGLDGRGELNDIETQYFWQERETFNHLSAMLESRLAKLSRVKPAFAVLPTTSDEKDIKSAKVAKNILRTVDYRINLTHLISRATKWSELCGTSFYKVIWDKTIGRLVGIDERGNEIFEGDVNVVVCPPFEIYPDNMSAERIDDCNSIMHVRAYHVDAIKQTWNVEVVGSDIDVFTFDSNDNAGGLGYNAQTTKLAQKTKKNHAIVVEYYEMPSETYKNGRLVIIADKTLVYVGDLPFCNLADKKRGFPFVRQVSMEQASNFWGSSIIERLIPLQRAYNAVKNRKHEYLNRLSMGVLTVEDGSVDTDNLEEEGISPGKVLVYRQGSTPPSFMHAGNVPIDFSLEEDRLLSEMMTLAGISDLMRNITKFSNISGIALQLLIEQDDARLTSSAEQIREAIKLVGQNILRLYKQFAKTKRIGRIIGNNASVETFYFNSSDISSEDVMFETENELTETIAQRRSMVFELLNRGLLHDESGKLDNRMRSKVLELLGFGIWEEGQDVATIHRNKAQKENIECANFDQLLNVDEIDDHEIHIKEHTVFLLSNYTDDKILDSKAKNRIQKHIKLHKQVQKLSIEQDVANV